MARKARALTLGALLLACGDAILVTGDAPSVMRVIAGVGDSIGTRVDTLATRTRLTEPSAVAFDDASSVLWLADRGATVTTQGITRRVARLFSVQSNGRISLAVDRGGCVANVCLEAPFALALAADGAVLITDAVGHRIFRWSPDRGLDVIAGDGVAGSTADGAPARGSRIHAPAGMARSADGRIYFAERGAHRVRASDGTGTLGSVAGSGERGFVGDDGPALLARLADPAGLAWLQGRLFIADAGNHRVRVVNLDDGRIASIAGNGTPGFAGDEGPALDARLQQPLHLALDPRGSALFISDYANDRVRVIVLQSGVIRTFAGDGSTRFTPAGRPAGATALFRPGAVATSVPGFVFMADAGHSVVWRTLLR